MNANELSGLIQAFRDPKAGQLAASALISAVPYACFLGFQLKLQEGEIEGCLSFSERLIGNPRLPALHGGTLGALLELTSQFQVLHQISSVKLPKTINITVDYLRSAGPQSCRARAIVTKKGRRVVNVRAEAYQESRERLVAVANAHFLIASQE